MATGWIHACGCAARRVYAAWVPWNNVLWASWRGGSASGGAATGVCPTPRVFNAGEHSTLSGPTPPGGGGGGLWVPFLGFHRLTALMNFAFTTAQVAALESRRTWLNNATHS